MQTTQTKTRHLNIFIHNGAPYLRCIPAKNLVRSSLIYEVLTRGDIFAINLNTGILTVISGKAEGVTHLQATIAIPEGQQLGLDL